MKELDIKVKTSEMSVLIIAFIPIISSVVLLLMVYVIRQRQIGNSITTQHETNENIEAENTNNKTTEAPDTENSLVKFENPPAYENATYFEEFPIIEGQQAYIAHPLEIDSENPPRLIIYSHGSITNITDDISDQQMIDLRAYADYFTSQNFIIAASNQHGANWGSQEAVDDTYNLFSYLQEKYQLQEKAVILGFSMGGLPSFNYAFAHPETVYAMTMLAPTTYAYTWTPVNYDSIKDIPIKIWHGNMDVNVPLSLTTAFQSKCEQYNCNLQVEIIDGATHWDVDTERIIEIYQYLSELENNQKS